jgi:hypothetical protein
VLAAPVVVPVAVVEGEPEEARNDLSGKVIGELCEKNDVPGRNRPNGQ